MFIGKPLIICVSTTCLIAARFSGAQMEAVLLELGVMPWTVAADHRISLTQAYQNFQHKQFKMKLSMGNMKVPKCL